MMKTFYLTRRLTIVTDLGSMLMIVRGRLQKSEMDRSQEIQLSDDLWSLQL